MLIFQQLRISVENRSSLTFPSIHPVKYPSFSTISFNCRFMACRISRLFAIFVIFKLPDVTTELYYITGGSAQYYLTGKQVKPKTWQISAFADANWFLRLRVFTTDQPRS